MKAVVCPSLALFLLLVGCATQTPPVEQVEGPQSIDAQKKAQAQLVAQAPAKPTLKRKIAIGRVSNESGYGRSLLRDKNDDPLGKQVADMMAKALVESGSYIVLERPDIELLQGEAGLSGKSLDLAGVDALVIGSVTELGRKVVGKTGFLSDSKRQVAFAKLDARLVDASTGIVLTSVSGAGEASTETASVAGFGSQASYDGTLNDTAIRQAVSEVVSRMSAELLNRRWWTSVLQIKDDRIFISGGKEQGVLPGMEFAVETAGERVKSHQTGFFVTLPGKSVASIKVVSNFGDTIANEGSVATLVSGKIEGIPLDQLIVITKE